MVLAKRYAKKGCRWNGTGFALWNGVRRAYGKCFSLLRQPEELGSLMCL